MVTYSYAVTYNFETQNCNKETCNDPDPLTRFEGLFFNMNGGSTLVIRVIEIDLLDETYALINKT